MWFVQVRQIPDLGCIRHSESGQPEFVVAAFEFLHCLLKIPKGNNGLREEPSAPSALELSCSIIVRTDTETAEFRFFDLHHLNTGKAENVRIHNLCGQAELIHYSQTCFGVRG